MKLHEYAIDIVNFVAEHGFSGLSLEFTEAKLKEIVLQWSPADDPVYTEAPRDTREQPELPLEEAVAEVATKRVGRPKKGA
jgi:hypothetical protein